MLHSMQESIANTSAQITHDFAGLLAALAAAKPTELPAWDDEPLPQDVVTLSYERALRTHARYKPVEMCSTSAQRECTPPQNERASKPPVPVATSGKRERKCASITIRMSQAECEQLRERAAEAGMTISAFLRSCTFEAETLRAQVKEALAELRRAPAPQAPVVPASEMQVLNTAHRAEPTRGQRLGWLRRIFPDSHPVRNVVRA